MYSDSDLDSGADLESALWPLRIAACCKSLRDGPSPSRRDALRGETWAALHAALMRFLRARVRRGYPSREDLEDIASAKAIELLSRAESGVWTPEGRSAGEIASYVATVARNGLVDFSRRTRHEAHSDDDSNEDEDGGEHAPRSEEPPPHALVEGRELSHALRDCVQRLQPRARRVWFFRAFYEMTSREIAAHPDVGLEAAYVDVVAKRARDSLRACLAERGLDASEPTPGAFVELWAALESVERLAQDRTGGTAI